jgi:hypothetical protein
MTNRAPSPGTVSTSIVPPCFCAITEWARLSPWPVPTPTPFVVKNGSNTRALTSGVIPGPSSAISIRSRSPRRRVEIRMRPGLSRSPLSRCSPSACAALMTMLSTTCFSSPS